MLINNNINNIINYEIALPAFVIIYNIVFGFEFLITAKKKLQDSHKILNRSIVPI